MKSIGVLLLILLAPGTGRAAETTARMDFEGRWDGAVMVRPAVVEVGLTASLQRTADGSWTGTLFSPTHQRREMRIEALDTEGRAVSFVARGDSSVSQFHGTVSTDGLAIEGEVLEGGKRALFRLRRATEKAAGDPAAIETLAGNLEKLRRAFNEDQAKVRLLVILSPGCSDCRMKAFLIQQYLLEQIPDPKLRVYLVWEKVGAADSLALAREVTWLPPDPRVRLFWSEEQLAGKAFNEAISLSGKAAWDVFLVYPAGQRWSESLTPRPDSFMHNLPEQYGLPKDRTFDVLQLADQVKALLLPPDQSSTLCQCTKEDG
jgi:hypothetical protein